MQLPKYLLILYLLIFPNFAFARVTPEDILNQQQQLYLERVKSYSAQSKETLEQFSLKISQLNKLATDQLSINIDRQSQILDEYLNRQSGRSTPAIDNARYWLTYAHEAVAFQAAKVYVFNLTTPANIKTAILYQINSLESDINLLSSKVIKSQKIIRETVAKQ